MKKVGNFFFSFVPFLLGTAIQYVAVFMYMIISAVVLLGFGPILTGKEYEMKELEALWSNLDFNTLIMIVFSVSCAAIFGLWYYKSCGGDFIIKPKKEFTSLQVAGLIILVPAAQFFTSFLVGIISSIFPKWLEDYENLMETAGMGDDISLLMLLYSVCLAPISEELIFRGVTLRIARRTFPFWVANVIQAVLFGVFHGNMLQGCYAFALGMILGYICEHGGTIYHAILFHFMFNFWGTMVSPQLAKLNPAFAGMLILAGLFIGMPVGILLFNKGTSQKNRLQAI